jgi:hypothetical protein
VQILSFQNFVAHFFVVCGIYWFYETIYALNTANAGKQKFLISTAIPTSTDISRVSFWNHKQDRVSEWIWRGC